MLQLVLTAPRSGGGKTTAACALLAALAARGQGRTTLIRCSTALYWG